MHITQRAVATHRLDSSFLWFDLAMSDLLLVYAAEVAVAKAVVDLCDVGEELRLLDPCEREGGLLTCVHRSYT